MPHDPCKQFKLEVLSKIEKWQTAYREQLLNLPFKSQYNYFHLKANNIIAYFCKTNKNLLGEKKEKKSSSIVYYFPMNVSCHMEITL